MINLLLELQNINKISKVHVLACIFMLFINLYYESVKCITNILMD